MASGLNNRDNDGAVTPSRARTAVENLLPAGIVRRSRSRPPSTPHMERSLSSMGDSFVDYWGVCSRNPVGSDGTTTPDPDAKKEDALTPISNWAHLNYMKTQRSALRADLKAYQVASTEAKRSVASLRRLALRMAVNITVKEKQIATNAKNLTRSRKSHYLEGREAEKRVEELKRALQIEEGRNKEILEALERASMLTLQYANRDPEAQQRRQRNPLSPPPSPPTRLSTLAMTPTAEPQTPPRSTSSSWHNTDWQLTPASDSKSPAIMRTSNSRLIRAKRESDHALAVCRSRIQELQAECENRKEEGNALKASTTDLEKEIKDGQARITTLEQTRAAIAETLESTRLQVEVANGVEEGLKQKLRMKNKELSSLTKSSEEKDGAFESLQKERQYLKEQYTAGQGRIKDLELRTISLENELKASEDKLTMAEDNESALRTRLIEMESADVDLKKRLDRASKYEQILQKKLADLAEESSENAKKVQVGGGVIATLRHQLTQSEDNKKATEEALEILRSEVVDLKTFGKSEVDTRDRLSSELEATRLAKTQIQGELEAAQENLKRHTTLKDSLSSELEILRLSQQTLDAEVQTARSHIKAMAATDAKSQTRLELLEDEKSAIEADLKDARQTLFRLREDERIRTTELIDMNSSMEQLQLQLKDSRKRESSLETILDQMKHAQATDKTQWEAIQSEDDHQRRELQSCMSNLQSGLAASETQRASLQEQILQMRTSNQGLQDRLSATVQSKTHLESKLDDLRLQLKSSENDTAGLKAKAAQLQSTLDNSQQTKYDLERRVSTIDSNRDTLQARIVDLELALTQSRNAKSEVEESLRLFTSQEGAELTGLRDHLSKAQGSRVEVEERLRAAETARTSLEDQLQSAKSELLNVKSKATDSQSRLSDLQEDICELSRSKSEVEERLTVSQHAHGDSELKLKSTESQVNDMGTTITALTIQLANSVQELEKTNRIKETLDVSLGEALKIQSKLETELGAALQDRGASEKHIQELLGAQTELKNDLTLNQSHLSHSEQANSIMALRLGETESELNNLRSERHDLQGQLTEASKLKSVLEADLSTTRLRLSELEGDKVDMVSKLTSTELKLNEVQQIHSNAQEEVGKTRKTIEGLQKELVSAKERIEEFNTQRADLELILSKNNKELASIREDKSNFEQKLEGAEAQSTAFEGDLVFTRSLLHDLESHNTTLSSEISTIRENLDAAQSQRSEIEEKLKSITKQNSVLAGELSLVRSYVDNLQAEKASLSTKLAEESKEKTVLHNANCGLEEQIKDALQRNTSLENDVQAIQMRLNVAESERLTSNTAVIDAVRERDNLRDTNTKLATSEKDLLDRLASAEEELQNVKETNARLDAFLERVEEDMSTAEIAFEESERRLEEFVEESQAKLDAARSSKLKYKQKLSERNKEIEVLNDERSGLQYQIREQTAKMDTLVKSKEPGNQRSRDGPQAETKVEDTMESEVHDDKERFALSFAALEQDLRSLRDDKKAFEKLVATLQQKIKLLETATEWQRPVETGATVPSGTIRSDKARRDSLPSIHSIELRISRPSSLLSQPSSAGHLSVHNERPMTGASTASKQEVLDAWAREVEKVRMHRNEVAIQLKDNKKARDDLRKSLKESKTQLHHLEREGKPKRQRTVLKKSRPSTPLRASTMMIPEDMPSLPSTPSRPATAAERPSGRQRVTSRHTIHFSPVTKQSPSGTGVLERPNTASPLSASRRWSTLPRPTSTLRPSTSGLFGARDGERPTTSAGELGKVGKGKRKWSHRLSRLFTGKP